MTLPINPRDGEPLRPVPSLLPCCPKDRELDQKTLEEALQLAADFLREIRRELTVIAAGGVASVLFLKSRNTTYDVDFFGAHMNGADLKLLNGAIKHAERRYQSGWATIGSTT